MSIQRDYYGCSREMSAYVKFVGVTAILPIATLSSMAALGVFNNETPGTKGTFNRELFRFWVSITMGTSLFAGWAIHLFDRDLAQMDARDIKTRKVKHINTETLKIKRKRRKH